MTASAIELWHGAYKKRDVGTYHHGEVWSLSYELITIMRAACVRIFLQSARTLANTSLNTGPRPDTHIYGGRDVLRLDNHVHRQSRLDRLACCLSKASCCLLVVLILALRSKRTEQTSSTTPWTSRRPLHWPCKTSSFGRLVQGLRFLEKGIR